MECSCTFVQKSNHRMPEIIHFLFYVGCPQEKKNNAVVILSHLQVIGLQSSVFLNLPRHCLDRESVGFFFIRLKKNVPAISKITALQSFAHNTCMAVKCVSKNEGFEMQASLLVAFASQLSLSLAEQEKNNKI